FGGGLLGQTVAQITSNATGILSNATTPVNGGGLPTAGQVFASLQSIPALSTPGAVSVVQGTSSGFTQNYYIQFGGALAGQNVNTLTTSPSGITAAVATNLDGSAGIARAQVQTTTPSYLVDVYFGGGLGNLTDMTATNINLTGATPSVAVNAVGS